MHHSFFIKVCIINLRMSRWWITLDDPWKYFEGFSKWRSPSNIAQAYGDPIEVIFRVLEPAETLPAFTTTIPEEVPPGAAKIPEIDQNSWTFSSFKIIQNHSNSNFGSKCQCPFLVDPSGPCKPPDDSMIGFASQDSRIVMPGTHTTWNRRSLDQKAAKRGIRWVLKGKVLEGVFLGPKSKLISIPMNPNESKWWIPRDTKRYEEIPMIRIGTSKELIVIRSCPRAIAALSRVLSRPRVVHGVLQRRLWLALWTECLKSGAELGIQRQWRSLWITSNNLFVDVTSNCNL